MREERHASLPLGHENYKQAKGRLSKLQPYITRELCVSGHLPHLGPGERNGEEIPAPLRQVELVYAENVISANGVK
ncbi:hypothetical protein EVAR_30324_1 [Eumeta japonica]|uniref:Uncharacterized protein n=1 Tax=Eumeta variegata TaxID=151549 RepID=A0A4C1W9R2_EUMVA|nr:hypothetical protein EVAR_30324_1 [Eumeta japonica]